MAILRLDQVGYNGDRPLWEGIAETQMDLGDLENDSRVEFNGLEIDAAPGSLMLCLEDWKVYGKIASGSWTAKGSTTQYDVPTDPRAAETAGDNENGGTK